MMATSTSNSSTTAPSSTIAPTRARSRFERLVSEYRRDHRNPVNHVLHVGVGWPLAALGVILLPFRPLWGAGLFLLAYAIMFFGHFVFERNIPTVLKHPSTPFVIAWNVIQGLARGTTRLFRPSRSASA
jgi:hypothetical protein